MGKSLPRIDRERERCRWLLVWMAGFKLRHWGVELKIGCPEGISAILPPLMERFSHQYPRVVVDVEQVRTVTLELPALRERRVELVLGRPGTLSKGDGLEDDLDIEVLFNEKLVVVAGNCSRWARRRTVDLAELVGEPWILTGPGEFNYNVVAEAFRARGLDMPRIAFKSASTQFRANMVATGRFIATFPGSLMRFNTDRLALKVLPIELPLRRWPFAIVTLKHRTLSPLAERFIEHVREFTRPMRDARST